MGKLEGKVAVVTGASSGIGRATDILIEKRNNNREVVAWAKGDIVRREAYLMRK